MLFKYNAIVKEINELNDHIKTFKIELKSGVKIAYKAGQFTTLGLPEDPTNPEGKWDVRAYSITSAPSKDKEIEFFIILKADGKLTPKLFALKEGDELYMGEKALGTMKLDDVEDDANLVFLGTGTGMAPLRSIIRENKELFTNGKRKVSLFCGVRRPDDIGYQEELEEIANSNPDFSFFPTVSRPTPEDNWQGQTGYIQQLCEDVLKKEWNTENPLNPENTYVFMCGNSAMINEAVEMLLNKGFTEHTLKQRGNVRYDKH